MNHKTYKVKVFTNGDKYWYLNGELHREDGPAIEYADGSKFWYLNDKRHREDGPAIEWANGTKHWFLNGKYHREDGPAVERANGDKKWYLNGKKLSYSEWKEEIAKLNQPTCNGKVVEIEGKKYRLMEVE